MKRLCFLVDSIFSIGGVQRVTAVMARQLADYYDVTIVTLEDEKCHNVAMYGLSDKPITFRHFKYPDTPWWKTLFCKAYSMLYRKVLPKTRLTAALYAHSSFPSQKRNALAAELRSGGYACVIGVHAPLAVRLASLRRQLKGVQLMGWIHNSYEALFGKGSLYIGPELRQHYEWQLEKLDATVVLSKDDARKYHFPTHIIYNPLTLQPDKRSDGTSRKFLAVGRFSHRHKGFDLLIEAFAKVAKRLPEWTLHIVGEGVEEPLYRELMARYGIADRVIIHPFTNNVQQYYSEAQVYVLSSRWEGFGLVLVEAMAHGLTVVSSDLPTSKEIMGTFGIYFENGNVEQLAERLVEAAQCDFNSRADTAVEIAARFDVKEITWQWRQLIDM